MSWTIHIPAISIEIVETPDAAAVPPAGSFTWIIGPVTTKEILSMPAEINLTTEQQVLATITPVTAAGNPATLDGEAVWTVTSGTCTVTPVDATSAWLVSGDIAGDSTVVVSADADLGAGVQTISDTCLLHVANPQAASLGLTLGEPELKPAP